MKCEGFNCTNKNAKKVRINTNYVNDDLNYKILCKKCEEEEEEYWKDMWDQYYNDCL